MEVEQRVKNDIQIYEYILQIKKTQWRKIRPFPSETAFFTHTLFKVAVILFLYFQDVLNHVLGQMLDQEIIIFFIILDFWFTKNYNGRRLLGLRWYFSLDKYGNERFFYETRINSQFVSRMSFRIFWCVQLAYIGYPIVHLYVIFHVQVFISTEQLLTLLMQALIFIGGASNLFLFYKAHMSATKKNMQLQKALGIDFVTRLSKNSLISYL